MSFQQQKRSSSVLNARNYNTQDFSIGSDGRNSFSIPKLENYFSGAANENLFNVSAITLPSEQTFRQNASPKRPNQHHIMYSDKKRDITNSIRQTRDKSFERASFRTNGSHENSPMRIKPTEKSFQSQQTQQTTPYKSLPERLVLTKAELNEKSRQLEEVKTKNNQLASEVKSYAQKENIRSLDVETLFHKFNVNVRRMSVVETYEKYQELLVAYRQSLTQNHQVEQSLRQEIITSEEQRAYIEALKMELKELKLSILLSPNAKITPEELEEMQSAKEQLPITQNECFELKQQLERFARSETTLKLMIENLRSDIQNLQEKKEQFQVSLESNQQELSKSQDHTKTLQSEVSVMKKENSSLQAKANVLQGENSRFKHDCEKLLEEIAFVKTDKIKDEEILRSQIDQLLREMDEKDEIIRQLKGEKSHLAQENIRSSQALNNANKKLAAARNECDELAKQSLAFEDELGRERKAVVQLHSQVKELGLQAKHDAKKEKMKEKVKIQQSLQEKMKERDDLMEELERIKGDDGNGHRRVKKLQNLENLREREREEEEDASAYLDEERDKVFQENKALHRKVRILADRVNDLKGFQGKHNLLFDFVKTTAQSLKIICHSKFSLNIEQFKRHDDSLEAYFQQISDLISLLDKFNIPKIDPNQEHQSKAVSEAMKWKDEAERHKEKVKTLNKELTLSSEAQERLYKRLSKVEVELEIAKKGGETIKIPESNNTNDNNKTAKLIEEISLKNLEIKKLQELVFSEEGKEMIAEIIQVNKEIFAQNKASRSKGSKNENIESRKTVLEEEFYLLQIQEKKKYENVENLEQQNFELQNEVSRLVTELEINFSHGTSAYHTYKRNEKQGQSLQNSKSSATDAIVSGSQNQSQIQTVPQETAQVAPANLDNSVSEIIQKAKKDSDNKKTVKDINLSRPKRIKRNESPGGNDLQH